MASVIYILAQLIYCMQQNDFMKKMALYALIRQGCLLNLLSANQIPFFLKVKAKVDFKLEGAVGKDSIEEKANDIISGAKQVTEEYDANNIRCIKIEGLCTDPCSGTHLSDTNQITQYQVRKIDTKKGRLTVGYNAKYHGALEWK